MFWKGMMKLSKQLTTNQSKGIGKATWIKQKDNYLKLDLP